MLSAPKARDPVELILLYHFLLYVNVTGKKFSLAQVSLLLTASSDLPNLWLHSRQQTLVLHPMFGKNLLTHFKIN
jgi:hypothetical protein